ncbi:glycosyltransferase family 71 protein [Suhomyces tanzawaensis NRRL Y-17324]|uniref:Glycosyltransferase family 71 protein n=1 Tax=Suhomyces tanzawaensis NRRL Y-17324 TaxID=984487 RepID=A0A1E4SFX7_9ASCO|nr:glycosyltransferase family 71 protein [Suhomyces tanzawaensis NRRL Y-17324]ODV78312.1 glycosyltransferase family 71 protein [Suhomyces tanzawaensis NRRL Y-17324]
MIFFHNFNEDSPIERIQDAIDKVDNPEYGRNLINEIKITKEKELIDLLRKDIEEKNTQKFHDELRFQIVSNFSESFKEELQKEIKEKNTKEMFEAKSVSYELFDNLKAEYLKKHGNDIEEVAILEVMQDLKMESSPGLSKKVKDLLHQKMDRSVWYKYLINDLLIKFGPKDMHALTKEERGDDFPGTFLRDIQQPPISKNVLLKNHVNLSKERHAKLKEYHAKFVDAIKRLDDPPKQFVNGDGIVISGGGVYFGSALVAIGQMREMGSKLPIELVINDLSEYDEQICEVLLPKTFNARCIVIEKEIGKELLEKLKLTKFQMKIFGLLFSSFDNIITIDADNMPIKNVDTLLTSEPYLSTKFILWPDIWHKGVSPLYYDIAGFKVGTTPIRREGLANDWPWSRYPGKDVDTDVAYHDLEGLPGMISIETGQMVFSKRAHFKSFLLSLYYNIYGPDFYYRLLFQGVPGEGDRETFVPALHLLKEPYHIVPRASWLAGYKMGEKQDGDFQETTIVQYDPTQTVKLIDDWEKWLKKHDSDTRLWPYQSNKHTGELMDLFKKDLAISRSKEVPDPETGKLTMVDEVEEYKFPDVFFLHIHKPKINPIENAKTESYGIYTRRNLGLQGTYPEYGKTDWELKFHSIAKWIACEGITSQHFWDTIAEKKKDFVCEKVTEYVEFLKQDTTDPGAEKLSFAKN